MKPTWNCTDCGASTTGERCYRCLGRAEQIFKLRDGFERGEHGEIRCRTCGDSVGLDHECEVAS